MNKIPRGQTPERRAYMQAWYASHHKCDRRAYKASYDAAHRDQAAAYRAANRERLKAAKAAYYAANRDRELARVKARAFAQPEKISSYHAEHYAKNTDRIKANVKAYRVANPEKARHRENRRRARKVGNGGSHTLAERQEKFARLGNVCFYCKSARTLTIDHDVPLARGGTDDIANIIPACRSCNSRKNTRTASEFLNHQRTGGIGGEAAGTR